MVIRSVSIALALLASICLSMGTARAHDGDAAKEGAVSFYDHVRPIFLAHCYGCHQPAKAQGKLDMTNMQGLLKGGESEDPAIVPGEPDEGTLIAMITPAGDKADMPKGRPPLAADEIALIAEWIRQGAKDDSPKAAVQKFTVDKPPVYNLAPVLTSLDYSPDGALLAVSGYHEVLLHKADGSERVARLVGLSERIESVKFSPDGKRLAVTGGSPGRMGEVQIWDVAQPKLLLSTAVTNDTLYGASWSGDGKLVAFGCGDSTLRAIDAKSGKQVFYQSAHNDWVMDTVFSVDSSHLVSVSRDRSMKLNIVATQRFVDNITSFARPGNVTDDVTLGDGQMDVGANLLLGATLDPGRLFCRLVRRRAR